MSKNLIIPDPYLSIPSLPYLSFPFLPLPFKFLPPPLYLLYLTLLNTPLLYFVNLDGLLIEMI